MAEEKTGEIVRISENVIDWVFPHSVEFFPGQGESYCSPRWFVDIYDFDMVWAEKSEEISLTLYHEDKDGVLLLDRLQIDLMTKRKAPRQLFHGRSEVQDGIYFESISIPKADLQKYNDCREFKFRASIDIDKIYHRLPPTPSAHPHGLMSYMESPAFSDVVLACDGHRVNGHRVVLAASSPKFADIFDDSSTGMVVDIPGIDYDTLKTLFSFAYSGSADEKKLTVKVYEAAKLYEFEALRVLCARHLIRSLNDENAVDLFRLGMRLGDKFIRNAAGFEILWWRQYREEFKDLKDQGPDFSNELLKVAEKKYEFMQSVAWKVIESNK